MKLSVSAFRAQASAQRKILSSYQNQLNYGACTSISALGSHKLQGNPQMMVDSTGINPTSASKPNERAQSSESPGTGPEETEASKLMEGKDEEGAEAVGKKEEAPPTSDKSPGRTRSKSNQRWMKLRTTVQLSGAITSTNQKSKPPLKREDSFLKRFSTRQMPETQETVDTGDETETVNGSQTQNEVNRRRRKRRKEMSKTVVNPDENFYFYWLMTVTICVLYNLWTLIVRQSFPELQKGASSFWYSGDGFTDVVFVCDIVVQFRTGYLEQGLMVYNSRKLASHYLKSRAFILDILSLLPLDFIQLNIGVNPILRFPRFLKVYRVYNYYYMVESRTVYPNLWRVVNLIHILLILAHWFGCFYYLLSEAEGFQGDWVYPYRPGEYATLTRKYLGSLYWSTLTLTTIGDLPTPETNAESRGRSKAMTGPGQSEGSPRRGHKSRLLQFNSNYGYLFTIISYLIGVFIFATIVGQVGNVITNRNANRLEFERLLDGAKTYMRHHKVPGGMKRRVLRWYDYSWSRGRIQGGGDINTALGLLPDKLKTELALHVNLSVLKKVTIFQECQPEFLHDLVLKMKAYIFTPGDLICRKGEVAREMFIIADGILDVISENGRVLTTMKAGDFFGEIGILNLDGLNKRTADVRSVGYSELFSLSREDVLTAMKDYPEAQEILQSLGRKRLMEAKNASKIYKAQVKQGKDYDSSGDSDTTGKRIVEKLRSDVKGLKNVLRRSRRGTRTKETLERMENSGGKTGSKKHSILRRMSHVQSSDEYENNNDVDQSPIGAGLPLLQRLKLLKEKQERDREEKERKSSIVGGSQTKKDENADGETTATGLPFSQKLKFLTQKESKETALGSLVVSSTVRTQVTGVRFSKSKSICSPREIILGGKEKGEIEPRRKESDSGRISLKERLKMVQVKEKIVPSKLLQEEEAMIPATSETSNNVPINKEAESSVPKFLKNKFEVPKSREAWKLLKNSSITSSKTERKLKPEAKPMRNVTRRGTYLSKSDTVLEKQKTVEREDEKRSRSISPSDNIKAKEEASRRNEEELVRERRRSRSVGHSPRIDEETGDVVCWEIPKKTRRSQEKMKKYNSISDLSPEYSGLPFVKKLKILNERQKLEELEKELLVRSVSLDVPERPSTKRGNVLVRSHSEASTIEYKKTNGTNIRTETSIVSYNSKLKLEPDFKFRKTCENPESQIHSESSIASPESNETLERRHLKSILKKLSAEDSTSDEDQVMRRPTPKRDNADLKKLMRAPTVEGYAARHKKLTKSVTFDSDTLPSPTNVGLEQAQEEPKGKSFPPMSPTAILTLQLSNISMIPIARTNKTEENGKMEKERTKVDASESEMTKDEEDSFGKLEKDKENLLMPYALQELIEKNFRILPFIKSLDDEYFKEIKERILVILQQCLEEVQIKVQSQLTSLQVEVEKRDEIILQLQSKIQELETNNLLEIENRGKILERNSDNEGTDPDPSEEPFIRSDSFETVRGVCSPSTESPNVSSSPKDSPARAENQRNTKIPSEENAFLLDSSELSFDYLGNVINYDEEYPFETKDKISLLPETARGLFRRDNWKSFDQSVEELELSELPTSFDFKRKRHRKELQLVRNFSMNETESEAPSEKSGKTESRSKGSFINRVTQLQRTFSCSQERTPDFVALDIDDSSNSSDTENRHNKDWEVQMLVEELAKKDPEWKPEERWRPETEFEDFDDVKKLEEEVDTLKQMVCDSDLTRLTNSELDILETIIEAKDQKISQLAKSNSFDSDGNTNRQRRVQICFPGQDNRLKKYDRRKKSSLRQKIGHALSFDFHDIESRKSKSPENLKQKAFSLRKQKTISYSPREDRSLYNLWHTSSCLRNRVLEDADRTGSGGSSLPILTPDFLSRDKTCHVRTSLPILSAKEFLPNVSERLTSSVSSSEDPHQETDIKQSCDSVFDEAEVLREAKERPNASSPSTSGGVKSNDCYPGNSLNSFIKSVGQRVKQVMAGDLNTVRNQVPTISKLCDERSIAKITDVSISEEFGDATEGGDSPKPSESFDRESKTDPPDL